MERILEELHRGRVFWLVLCQLNTSQSHSGGENLNGENDLTRLVYAQACGAVLDD